MSVTQCNARACRALRRIVNQPLAYIQYNYVLYSKEFSPGENLSFCLLL